MAKAERSETMTPRIVIEHSRSKVGYEQDKDVLNVIAARMIDRDYPITEIAKITGLSIEQVERLK